MSKARAIMYGAIRARVWIDYQPPLMLSDVVSLADFALVSPVYNLNLAEVVGIGENVLVGTQPRLGDTATVTDGVTLSYGYIRQFDDSVSMSDGANEVLFFGTQPTDSVSMSEGTTFSLSHPLADSVNMSDNISNDLAKTFADSVTMSEANAKSVSPATVADSVTMSDAFNNVLPATYIGSSSYGANISQNSKNVTFPAGTQAGDLAVMFIGCLTGTPTVTGGAGGWTVVATSTILKTAYVISKVLAAGDLAGVTVTTVNNDFVLHVGVWRGPTVSTLKVEAESTNTGSTLAFSGFTKSAANRCIAAAIWDQSATTLPVTWPSNWTQRAGPTVDGNSIFVAEMRDITTLNYVDGSTVTITGFDTNNRQQGVIVELT